MRDLRGLALQGWAQTLLLASCLLVLTGQLVPPAHAQASGTSQSDTNHTITLTGTERSSEGYFQLQVEGLNDQQQFVIEQSSSADFYTIEARFPPLGSFRQISLSGFDDGTYFFRARVEQGDNAVSYSTTHQVSVQHYPLWQALSLFGVGLGLFVALLTTLLWLHWNSQRGPYHRQSESTHG
ncbi:MAG: hypothetical protein JJU03_12795 [Idiomarina sp.]|nr:hypothetical protein [Idiomarina sp.]